MNADAFRIWTSAWFSGFGSTVSKDTISLVFLRIWLVFLGSEFVWFFRIGIRMVFFGSDLVGFLEDLDTLFFGIWIVSFADTKM